MHGRRLSDMAPTQQGTGNIKRYRFAVNFKRCMFARRQPKLGVFSTSLPLFLQESSFKKKKKKSGSSFSLFDRESSVWWARSRSIWNAGQATVACWPRTIQGSIHQSPASARPMILNGIYFHSRISSTGTVCEFRPFYTVILEFLSLHVYQTASPPLSA